MAKSQEIVQIEQIDKGLTALNTTITKTAENYLTLIKTIESGSTSVKNSGVSFTVLNTAQKQTTETAKTLDALDKQLIQSEAKLKQMQDSRTESIIKNRVAVSEQTKTIKDKLKADAGEEGSLARMRIKLNELTSAYDKAGVRTKEAAKQINSLSREIGKAEAATNRHSRGVGGYADQLGQLPGRLGAAASGAAGLGKQLWVLVANPIVAIIAAIVGVLTLLFSAFKSTDSGAVAFAGALKAIGNVVDVLMDRLWSFTKLLGSIVTFDWDGVKKNGKDTFGGIGGSIKDAANAGKTYATIMDSITDREAASLVRTEKLRKEYIELSIASKNRLLGSKEQARLAELAISKEMEANGIELGFMKEKTEAEKNNLLSKVRGDKSQFDEWVKITDLTLEKEIEKNAAFREFYNENEDEFKNLQKLRSEEIGKESEVNEKSRRMQTSLLGFKADLYNEEKAISDKRKANIDAENKKKSDAVDADKKLNNEILEDHRKLQAEIKVADQETQKGKFDLEDEKLLKHKEHIDAVAALDQEARDKEIALKKQIHDAEIELAIEGVNALFELNNMKFDKELNDLQVQKDKKLDNEKLTQEQRAQIEAEFTKKSNEIKTKQAKNDKIQGLFNIAINTAMAAIKSLANVGLPAGLPLMLATIAMGAVQAGLVAAQPIPKYARGGIAEKGLGIFGEAGRELAFLKSGDVLMANKATYFEGSKFKGAQIYSNPETEKILSASNRGGNMSYSNERIVKGLMSVEKAIKSKPIAVLDQNYRHIGQKMSNHQTIYINRLTRSN